MSQILIDNIWMAQIKKVLAFPDVGNLLLDDDEIKDYCIFPALQQYFTKFPISVEQTQSINGETTINFPDDLTFGVLDIRTVDIGLIGGSGGSFWDIVAFQTYNNNYIASKTAGAYGKAGYNPTGLVYQRDVQRQTLKSQQNQYVTIKSRVDLANRQIIAYSSITGTLNITWAKYSNNFNNVKFEKRNDVIALCQAELLMHLANSSSILTDSSLEVTINADYLKTLATELKDDVNERWSQIPDVILLHAV